MKILLSCLLSLFLTLAAVAQYRCIPYLDAHGNPGKINIEDIPTGGCESSGGGGASLTPVWYSVAKLSFPFYFNGQLVDAFKVSSTGVLTFDTLTTTPPPVSNFILPNPQIPDKSICILGLGATNTNESSVNVYCGWVNYRVTPSSRQLWITFALFTDIISNNSGTATWSIVLEENTNNIYIIDQCTQAGFKPNLTVGIQVDSSTAFMAPGSPNIHSYDSGNFYSQDNAYFQFSPGNALISDGTVLSCTLMDYLLISDAPFNVGAKFKNLGTDTINSLNLHYNINNGPIISQTFSGLNIAIGQSQTFYFSSEWTPPDTGVFQINIWADSLSTGIDEDTLNDHFLHSIYVAPTFPKRRALFEEFKATYCIWSAAYDKYYDSLLTVNNNKASNIKYQDQEPLQRNSFYHNSYVPMSYCEGSIMVTDSSFDPDYPGCPWFLTQSMIDSCYNLPGLFYIQPWLTLNGFTANITASVKSAATFPSSVQCKIYAAVIKDTIKVAHATGGSGETAFYNSVMEMFPDANGTYIGSPVIGQTDSISFSYLITDSLLNSSIYSVVVWVQDTITKEVYQCGESAAVQNCPPVFHSTTYNFCGGDSMLINGTWYEKTGNYPTILTGVNGCDSMEMSIVIVHDPGAVIVSYDGTLQWSGLSDITGGDTLHYCWYDATAKQIISGTCSNAQYPPPYTPNHSGKYALIVYNQMGCADTSNILNFDCTPDSTNLYYSLCSGDSMQIGNSWYAQSGTYPLYFSKQDGCDSILFYNLMVSICTGVDPVNPFIFSLYPNPAKDIVYLKISQLPGQAHVEVADISGRIITTVPLNNITSLNISKFEPGIYFFRVLRANELIQTQKLVVIR